MKSKKHFNNIEKIILKIIYHHNIPYTIYEIAKESDISYPTAKKYVIKLVKEEIMLKEGNKYLFNYKIMEGNEQ